MIRIIKTLNRNNLRWQGVILLCVLLAAITAAGEVVNAHFMGLIGEAVGSYADMDRLIWFLALLAGITAIRAFAAMTSAFIMGRWQGRVGYKLRENFFKYFLHVPFDKFEKAGSGESMSIFSNDIPQATNFVTEGGVMLISSVLNFGIGLAYMIWLHPFYTLLFFAFLPVVAIIAFLASRPMGKFQENISKETANFNAIVKDSLQNVSTIASYSLEKTMEKRYLAAYDKLLKNVRFLCLAIIPLLLVSFMAMFGPVAFINAIAGIGVIDGNMTLAEFIAFTAIAMQVAGFLMMLANSIGQLAQLGAGAKRLNENTSEAVEDLHIGSLLDADTSRTISFKNVTFSYGDDLPNVIDDVSFDIAPGLHVAIVGGSGSGKSTLLKLLMGIYKPNAGEIIFGGKNIADITLENLRNNFAYVPQDSFLFPESIGRNIAANDENIDKKKLEKAAFDAGILDYINALPDKFDGILAESSENISGGQRQRIAIARAFYKDAPVILLDEATAALDPLTEAGILNRLDEVTKGKTALMVAHRAKAIAACDCIIVMDGGKISGMGTHEELLASNAIYRNLYDMRDAEAEADTDAE